MKNCIALCINAWKAHEDYVLSLEYNEENV
jgi:hypothetical protein